jgi:hypothetical protein
MKMRGELRWYTATKPLYPNDLTTASSGVETADCNFKSCSSLKRGGGRNTQAGARYFDAIFSRSQPGRFVVIDHAPNFA